MMPTFEIRAVRTRRFWEPIARSLFLMATGAYALAVYLEVRQPGPSTEGLGDRIHLVWWRF
jgi:hypothetical protein